MSEEITFRYLNEEEQNRCTITMYQAITVGGLAVDNTGPLARPVSAFRVARHLRPEQLADACRWMISVGMLDQLEFSLQSVYERANDIIRDYLLANRQRTLIATQYKPLVALVPMLTLLMP